MKRYFARHGESEANVLHVVSNWGYQHGLIDMAFVETNLMNYTVGIIAEK